VSAHWSATGWTLALLLVAATAAGCGDDEGDTETAPEATSETVPDAIGFDGDACLVNRAEAVVVVGAPVTRDRGGDYFVDICYWDAEPRTGVAVSVEQFEDVEAAAARYAFRHPEDDDEPVAGLGEQAYLTPLAGPDGGRGARIEAQEGPYIVSVNVAVDDLDEDDLVALTRTALDRLPPP
jgi:hypothetical protein